MQTIQKKGLTVKDLVTIGIFSALFLVFALVGGIFFAPNPVLLYAGGQRIGVRPCLSPLAGQGSEALGSDDSGCNYVHHLVRDRDALGHGAGLSDHGHRCRPRCRSGSV